MNIYVLFKNLLVKEAQGFVERGQILAHKTGEVVSLMGNKRRQLVAHGTNALLYDYAIFGEQPPGLIDQSSSRLDIALSNTMNALNISLIG